MTQKERWVRLPKDLVQSRLEVDSLATDGIQIVKNENGIPVGITISKSVPEEQILDTMESIKSYEGFSRVFVNFALGDAFNALPGAYRGQERHGRAQEIVEKRFGPGSYGTTRNLGRVAKIFGLDARRRAIKNWYVYEELAEENLTDSFTNEMLDISERGRMTRERMRANKRIQVAAAASFDEVSAAQQGLGPKVRDTQEPLATKVQPNLYRDRPDSSADGGYPDDDPVYGKDSDSTPAIKLRPQDRPGGNPEEDDDLFYLVVDLQVMEQLDAILEAMEEIEPYSTHTTSTVFTRIVQNQFDLMLLRKQSLG